MPSLVQACLLKRVLSSICTCNVSSLLVANSSFKWASYHLGKRQCFAHPTVLYDGENRNACVWPRWREKRFSESASAADVALRARNTRWTMPRIAPSRNFPYRTQSMHMKTTRATFCLESGEGQTTIDVSTIWFSRCCGTRNLNLN